ncbi:MAG: hypothetical protein ACR2LU_01525 [Luteitalea sp.]|nr:hypothetical protein [Acidobacteriota bacterium]
MPQRFIVGLAQEADWQQVKRHVVAHGADWVRDPAASQPDVLVVSIPDTADAGRFVDACQHTHGVRYVEADAMGWTS